MDRPPRFVEGERITHYRPTERATYKMSEPARPSMPREPRDDASSPCEATQPALLVRSGADGDAAGRDPGRVGRRVGWWRRGLVALDPQVGQPGEPGRHVPVALAEQAHAAGMSTGGRAWRPAERDGDAEAHLLEDTSWPVAKPAKTTMMIAAAPVIRRAVEATPWTIRRWCRRWW